MRLITFCVVILSIFSQCKLHATFVLGAYSWFPKLVSFLFETTELYDKVDVFINPDDISLKEKILYDALNNVTRLIDRTEVNINKITIARINALQRDFSEIIHFEIKLDELINSMNQIQSQYNDFTILKSKLKSKLENDTSGKAIALQYRIMNFAEVALSVDRYSIRSCLTLINDLIIIGESTTFSSRSDIFTMILNNFNERTGSRCLIDESPQQLLYDTLTLIRLIQVKGLVIMKFSYIILHLYQKGDFRDEMKETIDLMMGRFAKQAEIAYKVIEKADNAYWRCDPKEPVFNKTYVEITRFLQGYIHNERELSFKGNCFDGCGYYQYVDRPGCRNDDNLCKLQTTCSGRVLDCKFVEEDMDICFANAASNRRYQYVRYSSGLMYGNYEKACSSSTSKIQKYRKLLLWRCLYCFCLCDEEMNSDRFFSLEPSVSDLTKNNVVVGVRFIKHNRILHLQVKEGKLESYGINSSTTAWVSLSNITVGNLQDIPKYHKLTYESRALDLDDLIAPTGFLLTGARFRMIGSHLNVEVRLTAFDIKTGVLFKDITFWKGNDNTDVSVDSPRKNLRLEGSSKRLPVERPYVQHIPDSQSDMYIEFQPSDEFTDAAQSTVPFIDIQSVTPNPPVPLIGLGIIHKGAIGSAGYLEPKVFTFNIAQYEMNKTFTVESEVV